MKAIIHAYSLLTSKTQSVLSGEIKKYILSGVYTFPLYALNEEVVELLDEQNEFVGYVAVRSLSILPKELVKDEELTMSNYASREALYNDDPDSLLCTILDIIPVAEGCECEEGCDCEGECECGEECKDGENCHCKHEE